MLFDPKWEQQIETKADPHSLEAVIAWLETQPADREYDFINCRGGCLVGQYGNATGIDWIEAHQALHERYGLYFACGFPCTFGAALSRARKVLETGIRTY